MWERGTSGNPSGRPANRAKQKPITRALLKFLNVAPEKLSIKQGDSVLVCFAKVNWQLALKGNQRAIAFVADHVEGPPVVNNGSGELVERIEGREGSGDLISTISAIYGIAIRDGRPRGRELTQLPEGEIEDESAI